MRSAAVCLALAGLASADALAQGAAAVEKLRACSVLPQAERLECLDKLSRDLGPPLPTQPKTKSTQVGPAAGDWVVSETTSPFDYSPIAIATATARSGDTTMQLSIQCRGGRTDLVIASPAITQRGVEYTVIYQTGDATSPVLPYAMAASGSGLAIGGNVVRLLMSLPDQGDVVFRIAARQGVIVEGRYALAGLKNVLARMAGPCKWPAN